MENALIVVAKQPRQGRTKTRLSPPLSLQQASELYHCFLADTLELVRQVPGVQPILAYDPASARDYFAGIAPDFGLLPQQGETLGERLDNALSAVLQRGYRRVAVMDSDSPTLPVACLVESFAALQGDAGVTLGPCEDGGYYLMGVKQPQPRLLREVTMSTPRVTADTLALAGELGLQVHLLPEWYDVDDGASLARLAAELEQLATDRAVYTRDYLRQAAMRTQIGAFLLE